MDITGKAVAVYGKRNDKLCFFKIYDYETEEDKAKEKFVELMNDVSICEYRMMTIETLSEILEISNSLLSSENIKKWHAILTGKCEQEMYDSIKSNDC